MPESWVLVERLRRLPVKRESEMSDEDEAFDETPWDWEFDQLPGMFSGSVPWPTLIYI